MNDESSSSRLGRGLGSMINEVSAIKAGSSPTGGGFIRIPINEIPLTASSRVPDAGLTESVRKFGVLQPILVARTESGFRLLAGARRLQAAQDAGLADVPALIISPDRAGAMDVFLEENLVRAELNDVDRMRLRDQWVRETGRDPELAKKRIPDLPLPPAPVVAASETPSRGWMIATLLLGPACVVLLATLFIANPDFKFPKLSTGTATEIAAPETARNWMDDFLFPGQNRNTSGNRLFVGFNNALFVDGNMTPFGARHLSQLAAVGAASSRPVSIRLLLNSSDAEVNQRHSEMAIAYMKAEGFANVSAIAEQRDPNLGKQSVVIAEIVPVD